MKKSIIYAASMSLGTILFFGTAPSYALPTLTIDGQVVTLNKDGTIPTGDYGGGSINISNLSDKDKARIVKVDTDEKDTLTLTGIVINGLRSSGGSITFKDTFAGGPNGDNLPDFVELSGRFKIGTRSHSVTFVGKINNKKVDNTLNGNSSNPNDPNDPNFDKFGKDTITLFGDRVLEGDLAFNLTAGDALILPNSASVGVIPEPTSLTLLSIALLGFGLMRRRNNANDRGRDSVADHFSG